MAEHVASRELPMPPGMLAEGKRVLRGATHTHRVLRSRIVFLVGATMAIDAVATVLMYLFEHGHRGSGFDDIGGALFWVSAQLTTVSSQMPNPLTTPGRIVDIMVQVWAISVVVTLAGALASFFRTRHVEHTLLHLGHDVLGGRMP
jgi:hypothetical protein